MREAGPTADGTAEPGYGRVAWRQWSSHGPTILPLSQSHTDQSEVEGVLVEWSRSPKGLARLPECLTKTKRPVQSRGAQVNSKVPSADWRMFLLSH